MRKPSGISDMIGIGFEMIFVFCVGGADSLARVYLYDYRTSLTNSYFKARLSHPSKRITGKT